MTQDLGPGLRRGDSAFIQLGDDRVEVLDIPAAAGSSVPPLLLLHEGMGSVSLWREYPAELAQATGARIVAYSRLGFGKSSARPTPFTSRFMHEEARDVLPTLRQALHLERPILLGHSTGGSIALLHAAQDPEHVAGVIAMAPLLDVEEGNLASIREARTIFETTPWRRKLERHHDHPIEQVFANWNDTWLDPGFRDWAIAGELGTITCPVLGIGGRDDPYSSPRQLELMAKGATHAAKVEVVLLDDCGHVPYRDQPVATMQAVERFVTAAA